MLKDKYNKIFIIYQVTLRMDESKIENFTVRGE